MFMQVAIGAVGIGVVLVIGFVVIAQAKEALPDVVEGNITTAMNSAQSTIFAGFGLIAVGIIVLAGFGMISLFK